MNELTGAGFKVCVLEAGDIPVAASIHKFQKVSDIPIETGAEFIHGKAPVTKELLRKANIEYTEVLGKMIFVRNGVWIEEQEET
jgi:monoamine oxidase